MVEISPVFWIHEKISGGVRGVSKTEPIRAESLEIEQSSTGDMAHAVDSAG